jgi:hypothetical protein
MYHQLMIFVHVKRSYMPSLDYVDFIEPRIVDVIVQYALNTYLFGAQYCRAHQTHTTQEENDSSKGLSASQKDRSVQFCPKVYLRIST